jgi:hypothetical protein
MARKNRIWHQLRYYVAYSSARNEEDRRDGENIRPSVIQSACYYQKIWEWVKHAEQCGCVCVRRTMKRKHITNEQQIPNNVTDVHEVLV